MPRLAIIADDLTGAADAAVAFAVHGNQTRVLLDPAYASADIVAVTTESRHLEPAASAARVRRIARQLTDAGWLYKKIDSTLRGNVPTDLLALMRASGETRALVAPAFPAQGRTTVQGRQLIDGIALEETSFGRQIASSDLPELFQGAASRSLPVRSIELAEVRQGGDALLARLTDPSPDILIADAETDADLDAIAAAALSAGLRVLCGSAGLCHALARLIPTVPASHANGTQHAPIGPILVIAGSLQPNTIAQIKTARASGTLVIEPRTISPFELEPLIDETLAQLHAGRDLILTSHQVEAFPVSDEGVAGWLAQLVEHVIGRVQIGALVLTGGDVASAVCRLLGTRAIDLHGEVRPGIAWGNVRAGQANGLPVATKAGGFGDPQALSDAISFLHHTRW